jgi:hypothetical protein
VLCQAAVYTHARGAPYGSPTVTRGPASPRGLCVAVVVMDQASMSAMTTSTTAVNPSLTISSTSCAC